MSWHAFSPSGQALLTTGLDAITTICSPRPYLREENAQRARLPARLDRCHIRRSHVRHCSGRSVRIICDYIRRHLLIRRRRYDGAGALDLKLDREIGATRAALWSAPQRIYHGVLAPRAHCSASEWHLIDIGGELRADHRPRHYSA